VVHYQAVEAGRREANIDLKFRMKIRRNKGMALFNNILALLPVQYEVE